jgi:hypothetical protein
MGDMLGEASNYPTTGSSKPLIIRASRTGFEPVLPT